MHYAIQTFKLQLFGREKIKGSIELTHGSICGGAKKLQSMNVLKWLSTKADRKIECPFQILAFCICNLLDIYNLLDISVRYIIKIWSYMERLNVNY